MKWILLFCLVFGSTLPAESRADEAATHFAAHFGLSYAISAAVYGFAEKGLGCPKTGSFFFAAVTTLMIGAVYKFTELNPNSGSTWNSSFGRAMGENALGIGAFGASVLVFKF